MAVTVTPVLAGANTYIADVEMTAGGDVSSGNIAHGLGAIPLDVSVSPLLLDFYNKTPYVTTIDITNVVVTCAAAGGVANDQMRVIIRRPFRMVQ